MKKLVIKKFFFSATAIIFFLMILNFVFHMLTGWQYGLFFDELYYYSMSLHLDVGYVDVTPITAWLMALSRFLLGDSVQAMHVFPALAGSAAILLAALTARKMGGGRLAQFVAGLIVLMAPIYMTMYGMFIYDAFDQFMSTALIYVVACILSDEPKARTWVLLGVVVGLGLMTKITFGFLTLSLVIGMLLTPARKYTKEKWFWIAAAIAVSFLLPYIVWQAVHGFPIADYLGHYTITRTSTPSVLQLFVNLFVSMNPLSSIFWLGGLILLFTKWGKRYRAFAWASLAYFAFAAICFVKFYALCGNIVALAAIGGVGFERIEGKDAKSQSTDVDKAKKSGGVKKRAVQALKALYLTLLCAVAITFVPVTVPILPVKDTVEYNRSFWPRRFVRWDNSLNSALPSMLSSRLGWEELARSVSDVYHKLPDEDRQQCAIFCQNYGEAGAIDYYAKKYGLPYSISGHLSHYYWGYGDYNGQCLILIGVRNMLVSQLMEVFETVDVEKGPTTQYANFYENGNSIYICRGLKIPLDEFWVSMRSML